jgi:hypothetical protein
MPVKKRMPKGRAELLPAQIAFLRDAELHEDEDFVQQMELIWLRNASHDDGGSMPDGSASARDLWAAYGEQALAEWIEQHPGTRPSPWWRFDAPKRTRQRCGGVGTAWGEHQVWLGIPLVWVSRRYPPTRWPGCPGPAVDPHNPPVFESQATYLDRHGLLLPGERRRLGDEDFRPVLLTGLVNLGDDDDA